MLEKAMRIAGRARRETRHSGSAPEAPSEDSLRLAREELSDPGVEQEAKIAVTALEQAIP